MWTVPQYRLGARWAAAGARKQVARAPSRAPSALTSPLAPLLEGLAPARAALFQCCQGSESRRGRAEPLEARGGRPARRCLFRDRTVRAAQQRDCRRHWGTGATGCGDTGYWSNWLW